MFAYTHLPVARAQDLEVLLTCGFFTEIEVTDGVMGGGDSTARAVPLERAGATAGKTHNRIATNLMAALTEILRKRQSVEGVPQDDRVARVRSVR